MIGCAKSGANFINCTPPELVPDSDCIRKAKQMASRYGSAIEVSHDPHEAVKGANVIYTDVWVSMGEEDKFNERIALLKKYQITMELIRATGNLEKENVIFLHCLPAFHNNETELTREIGALEVTDEVFEAPFSKVFELAENRLHTIKAIMVATLSEETLEL
jgi:ornithine carbamoyltransferase